MRWRRKLSAEFRWEELADGMPRRLVRGLHFHGSPAEAQHDAREAAVRLGKVSRSLIDKMEAGRALWVQFADAEIDHGSPCICGGRRLRRLNGAYARCETCRALLIIRSPLTDREVADERISEDKLVSVDEPVDTDPALSAAPPSPKPTKTDRSDRAKLTAYKDVQLVQYASLPDRRRFCGHGYLPNGRQVLLLVDFPGDEHDDILDPLQAVERAHTVSSFPIEPFEGVVDIDVGRLGR